MREHEPLIAGRGTNKEGGGDKRTPQNARALKVREKMSPARRRDEGRAVGT